MSWSCKYDVNGYCQLLHRDCEPTVRGCVLHGRMIRARDIYPQTFQDEKEKNNLEQNPLKK